MKIKAFVYNNSEKQVLVLHEDDKIIEGIDITKLNPIEALSLFSLYREYEAKLEPFIKKAYDKFNQDNIDKIIIEKED